MSRPMENYKIKTRQNVEKMHEVDAELRKVKVEFSSMTTVLESWICIGSRSLVW